MRTLARGCKCDCERENNKAGFAIAFPLSEPDYFAGSGEIRHMRRIMRAALTAAAATTVITACSSTPKINVGATWGSEISQYGIVALYPPRENVYVGDVYLFVHNPCSGSQSNLMQATLLGSLPVGDMQSAFESFYGTRPELPAEAASASGTPPAGTNHSASPQPTSSDIFWKGAPGGRPFVRLRLAAFPEMKLGSVTKTEIGGGGPLGGIAQLVGAAGYDKSTQVDVSVTGVEEADIPAPVFYRAVKKFLAGDKAGDVLDTEAIDKLYKQMNALMRDETRCEKPVPFEPDIIFVKRVFYARAIDFSFSDTQALAALVKASTQTPATGSGTGTPAAVPAAGATTAETAANALSSELASLAGSGTPGVGASLAVGSSGGLVLKQSFARPMAFGIDTSISFHLSDALLLMTPVADNAGHVRLAAAGGAVAPRYMQLAANAETPSSLSVDQGSPEDLCKGLQGNRHQQCVKACGSDPQSLTCQRLHTAAVYASYAHACEAAGTCGGETMRAAVPDKSLSELKD